MSTPLNYTAEDTSKPAVLAGVIFCCSFLCWDNSLRQERYIFFLFFALSLSAHDVLLSLDPRPLLLFSSHRPYRRVLPSVLPLLLRPPLRPPLLLLLRCLVYGCAWARCVTVFGCCCCCARARVCSSSQVGTLTTRKTSGCRSSSWGCWPWSSIGCPASRG